MKVALVHDWLNGMRGGEKVLQVLCEIFPEAPIYTLVHDASAIAPEIQNGRAVHTSWMQKYGVSRRHYRWFLPLMPSAVEAFRLDKFDLIVSSSHCVAKGVKAPPGAVHVSYCHTPMRYIWDLKEDYFGRGLRRAMLEPVLRGLQHWDRESARGVHHFIANSRFVAGRIERIYGRQAEVVHPPVDADFFRPTGQHGDYYLLVSALVPYKKVELVLETFRGRKETLLVIGSGPLESALRRKAPSNVRMLGWQGPESLRNYYAGCKALLFPQTEDFGIVPLEAQACGRPVIAFGQGGALETVVGHSSGAHHPPTGLFFARQTTEALDEALDLFARIEQDFDAESIRAHALRFDKATCRERLRDAILSKVAPGARTEERLLQHA